MAESDGHDVERKQAVKLYGDPLEMLSLGPVLELKSQAVVPAAPQRIEIEFSQRPGSKPAATASEVFDSLRSMELATEIFNGLRAISARIEAGESFQVSLLQAIHGLADSLAQDRADLLETRVELARSVGAILEHLAQSAEPPVVNIEPPVVNMTGAEPITNITVPVPEVKVEPTINVTVEPPARTRTVTVERDAAGRIAGYTIEEFEREE